MVWNFFGALKLYRKSVRGKGKSAHTPICETKPQQYSVFPQTRLILLKNSSLIEA